MKSVTYDMRQFILATVLVITTMPGVAEQEMELEGMSVVGNSELPKALFIVPWKESEFALVPERPVNSLVNEVLQPVDPDVFRRKLHYFDLVHKSD